MDKSITLSVAFFMCLCANIMLKLPAESQASLRPRLWQLFHQQRPSQFALQKSTNLPLCFVGRQQKNTLKVQ